jgi:hypothetical protein
VLELQVHGSLAGSNLFFVKLNSNERYNKIIFLKQIFQDTRKGKQNEMPCLDNEILSNFLLFYNV